MKKTKDVTIIGGGLAGLTLARHLKLANPSLDISVLERRTHPAQEACHKVGESSVEIGAHYFETRLQLHEHLVKDQLFKLGLRYFFPSGNNTETSTRFEIGPSVFPKAPSFQLDRGRFENYLFDLNRENEIQVLDNCRVQSINLAGHDLPKDSPHEIFYDHHGEIKTISSRWVIDATSRFSLIKRKLKLEKSVNHCCHSSWFRLKTDINIDQFSDDPAWKARLNGMPRRFSTNHFMGKGYWLWFIPLASGYTSVGLVIDDKCHSFEEIKKVDSLMSWLEKHEPICAKIIQENLHTLSDFKFLKNYAHGSKQVFSDQRWALTGEAGVFADPFYSPGSDLIAMSNDFIADLIIKDFQGLAISSCTASYNRIYLQIFEVIMMLYDGLYPVFGNAHVMKQKILWDTGIYLGVTSLLYFNKKLLDLDFMQKIGTLIGRYNQLNYRVQRYFKSQPTDVSNELYDRQYFDLSKTDIWGMDLNKNLYSLHENDDELISVISKNIDLLEKISHHILLGQDIAPSDSNSDISRLASSNDRKILEVLSE